MKLSINKACDLSSISVLPPYHRRSNPIRSGADSSRSAKMQPYHLRSQSQQSLSQGTALSQMSQGSLDEVLTNEQRFDSQERESTAKRLSCLAPITNSRDKSQMQQSRSSNHVTRRRNSSFTPEPKCHVSEELERRIGSVETSLNRLERTIDSFQSDLMQVNKAVKEASLDVAGIQQKIFIQDGHIELMLKREEEIKAGISETLKCIPDQLRNEAESSDRQKLHRIAAAVSSLPSRIEASLLRLQNEICGAFTREMENGSCVAARTQKNQSTITRIDTGQPMNYMRVPYVYMDGETPKVLKLKTRLFPTIGHSMKSQEEEILLTEQAHDFKVITDSDEEMDGGFSCLLKTKEAGWKSHLSGEARKESMRILRKARRKRKLDNTIVLD